MAANQGFFDSLKRARTVEKPGFRREAASEDRSENGGVSIRFEVLPYKTFPTNFAARRTAGEDGRPASSFDRLISDRSARGKRRAIVESVDGAGFARFALCLRAAA